MASSAVSNALAKLDLMLENNKRLYNNNIISSQFKPIHSELTILEGFLTDADSKIRRNEDVRVRQWVNEVRDVALRIEDAVDILPVDIDENRNTSSCRCRNLEMVVKNPIRLSEFHRELRGIRETLRTISESRIDLGIITNASSVISENDRQHYLRAIIHSEVDDSEIVGLRSEKSKITKELLDRRKVGLAVLSIVGAGGLGKTVLAQRVFTSVEVAQSFDCLILLPISHNLNENNLSRIILHSIRPNLQHDESTATDENIQAQVRTFLSKKRYLIILDDIRTPDLLQHMRRVLLPEDNNASRVLITCRDINVASMADNVYNLHALNADESLALLFKKAFKKSDLSRYVSQSDGSDGYSINSLVKHVHDFFGRFRNLPYRILDRQAYNYRTYYSDHNYPANLVEIAKKLAKKCGGLPLELIILGGILSTKEPHLVTWNKVNETLDRHDNPLQLPALQRSWILKTSYEDLPSHLKSCFLYFALFPEDYEISAKQVTRMWIAEGLVPRDGAGMGTIENKAEELLEELVQRCLVQVTERTRNGYAKHCRMHDSVREMAIREANNDNFFTILSNAEDLNQLDPAGSMVRRASLQSHAPTDFKFEAHNSKNTRSLVCFWECISRFRGFGLLRVLLIERVSMRGKLEPSYKNWLEGLIHLKYLGFRYCDEMPKGFGMISFRALKNLETLDCKKTRIRPSFHNNHSLWKVQTLRHVIISIPSGVHCPTKWNNLKNLQTLKWVSLVNLPNLQNDLISLSTLKIHNPRQYKSVEEGWRRLEALLLRTPHLCSLSVRITKGHLPFLTVGTRNVPCHNKIRSLWLRGEWSSPGNAKLCVLCVDMFPINLTKLRLECSYFHEDPMPVLERLQNLRILQLWGDSYLGTQMTCSTGGFLGLHQLDLVELCQLRQWGIQEGAMPALKQLTIYNCPKFHVIPELQRVPTIQRLLVTCASPVLKQRLCKEDAHKIRHISSVHVTVDTDTDA